MGLYVPKISDYKPFYIQRPGEVIKDIKDVFSVVVKTHDYPMELTPKEVYKNDWLDGNGVEEYIGPNGLYFQPFTFRLECVMFSRRSGDDEGAIIDLRNGIRNFRTFLSHGLFKTYDVWTGFGFQNVRLDGFPMPDSDNYDVWNDMARIIFDVRLKVNDPITRMVLTNTQGVLNIEEG